MSHGTEQQVKNCKFTLTFDSNKFNMSVDGASMVDVINTCAKAIAVITKQYAMENRLPIEQEMDESAKMVMNVFYNEMQSGNLPQNEQAIKE